MTWLRIWLRYGHRMPLWLSHLLGAWGGWLVWLFSPRYRHRWWVHVQNSGTSWWQAWPSVAAAGKMVAELPHVWSGRPLRVQWRGDTHIAQALEQRQSILFLTPHLGAFEVTPRALAKRFPETEMCVMYRPPRKAELAPLLEEIRNRSGLHAAPASLKGVRQLMSALKQGHAVGILPDQVPPQGMGTWVQHFGQPAYSMTLAARLAQQADVVLLAWGERLSWGRGYVVHVSPAPTAVPSDTNEAVQCINHWMEDMIRTAPEQYLWGYDRYKSPRVLG